MSKAFKDLGLPETARPEEVKAKWRELAKIHHPDYGGSAELFNKFHTAYKIAFTHASCPRTCVNCNGQGKITKQNGFSTTRLTCPVCKGFGALELKPTKRKGRI